MNFIKAIGWTLLIIPVFLLFCLSCIFCRDDSPSNDIADY